MAGHTRGAQGGRETFGGSHFLAQPGGGRCQTPGGRSEGGEAPAATPPFALQDGHLSPRREAGGSGGREEAVRPGAAAEEGDRPGLPAAGRLAVPLALALRPTQGFPRGSSGYPPFQSRSARGSGGGVRRRRRL